MADQAPPDDGYTRYFEEKLWDLVPATHRHEDGLAEEPGVLRAIVEILAAQAAVLRRSQDRLWDDSFIDLCDDWAVPYLGDLVATRLVSALNRRGRRIDVAKTVYYRRRKGTPRVLEELISDISGWEGKLTESFRRLGRARHGLDPAPPPSGRWSGTPQGGWADLRDVRAATLASGPFDEYAHTPDLRRQRGTDGLWNIPRVVFHLHRLVAYELDGVTPRPRADGLTFTFDPSGRDAPIFVPRRRVDDWDAWESARPWELPAPMTCRLLAHAEYRITEAVVLGLLAIGLTAAAADELRRFRGVLFRDEDRLRDQLALLVHAAEFLAVTFFEAILTLAITDESAKGHLLDAGDPALDIRLPPSPPTAIPPERLAAGNLADWSAALAGKDVIVDPDRGRFKLLGAAPVAADVRVGYHVGFPGEIGAGAYGRSSLAPPPFTLVPPASSAGAQVSFGAPPVDGAWQIDDSATYGPVDDVAGVRRLVVQAADRERPYVRLAADWVITAEAGFEAELVLDGLWLGAAGAFAVVLRGGWSRVTLRHVTLDPGGADTDGAPIEPVRLWVEGSVDELVVDRSITAPIATRAGGLIDLVTVRDSILHSTIAGVPVLTLPLGSVHMRRVTALGAVDVERLDASEALITGPVDVTDTQHGCFRFGAAPPGSRLPHPYRSVELVDAPHIFTSRVFGQPAYAQLSESAPVEIARGAENGSEMGAWSSLINPIKQDGLARKVDEYLPFGLVPCFVLRT